MAVSIYWTSSHIFKAIIVLDNDFSLPQTSMPNVNMPDANMAHYSFFLWPLLKYMLYHGGFSYEKCMGEQSSVKTLTKRNQPRPQKFLLCLEQIQPC